MYACKVISLSVNVHADRSIYNKCVPNSPGIRSITQFKHKISILQLHLAIGQKGLTKATKLKIDNDLFLETSSLDGYI